MMAYLFTVVIEGLSHIPWIDFQSSNTPQQEDGQR